SHWRVLWCAAGAGHVLFAKSPLTENRVRIYADSVDVARWLQRTIETLLFPEFADPATPVIAAQFARSGDARATAVATITSANDRIRMTWSDGMEPFVLTMAPGMNNRPIGVFSTFFPARSAQVELNGKPTANKPWPEMRGDRQSSSACLAWSETWV